jgi:hypothetical protein
MMNGFQMRILNEMVGVTGIEPATSCTPSKHATTALHPEKKVYCIKVVGVIGFEPTTTCSQSRYATRLRYTPNKLRELFLRLLGCFVHGIFKELYRV